MSIRRSDIASRPQDRTAMDQGRGEEVHNSRLNSLHDNDNTKIERGNIFAQKIDQQLYIADFFLSAHGFS